MALGVDQFPPNGGLGFAIGGNSGFDGFYFDIFNVTAHLDLARHGIRHLAIDSGGNRDGVVALRQGQTVPGLGDELVFVVGFRAAHVGDIDLRAVNG
jgi:hypothetical protein